MLYFVPDVLTCNWNATWFISSFIYNIKHNSKIPLIKDLINQNMVVKIIQTLSWWYYCCCKGLDYWCLWRLKSCQNPLICSKTFFKHTFTVNMWFEAIVRLTALACWMCQVEQMQVTYVWNVDYDMYHSIDVNYIPSRLLQRY